MMLHEAMDAAVREHLVVDNPTNGTRIPKPNYPPKQILTEEQVERFMAELENDAVWHDLFYTELTTGLRRGEICGLQWQDLDFSTGKLRIRRAVIAMKHQPCCVGETKTDAGRRTITLPPHTLEMLKNRKKTSYSQWIFPNPVRPEAPMAPSTPYHQMKRLLKQAGLPSIRFHDLRHTFATHALTSGVDAKTLAGILGHTNASFTLDTYTHVTKDMREQAANVVGDFLGQIM